MMAVTNAQNIINSINNCLSECSCSGIITQGVVSYSDYNIIVSFLNNVGLKKISGFPNQMFSNDNPKYLILVFFNYRGQDIFLFAQAVKTNCS